MLLWPANQAGLRSIASLTQRRTLSPCTHDNEKTCIWSTCQFPFAYHFAHRSAASCCWKQIPCPFMKTRHANCKPYSSAPPMAPPVVVVSPGGPSYGLYPSQRAVSVTTITYGQPQPGGVSAQQVYPSPQQPVSPRMLHAVSTS
jgi:hypothetical protein